MTRRNVGAAAAIALVCTSACSHGPSGYSGTLQAESADVGSTVAGRVIAVLVTDGQIVSKGQVIVRFDDKDQRAALLQADGALSQAESALADLLAGPRAEDIAKAEAQAAQAQAAYEQAAITGPHQIDQAVQAVRQARAAATLASRDLARVRTLYSGGAVSAQERDAAVAADRQARAQLRAAQAQLAAARLGSVPQGVQAAFQAYQAAEANAMLVAAGPRPDQIAQARAAVETARAGVQAAQARLTETVVRAPGAGVINSLNLRPGDLVAPGAAVATVDEFIDPYVRIYVAQSNLGTLQIGQTVTVRSDAFPGRTFGGKIEVIDQSAQFTPRDVQTAEDRANLVFGVKVRVHDPDRAMRGGETVEVVL